MSVWFVIPSKRPPEEAEPVLKLWKERGYKIALFRDDIGNTAEYERFWRPGHALTDLIFHPAPTDMRDMPLVWPHAGYPGYAKSVNELIRQVLQWHSEGPTMPDWFVTGGDDVEPDANHSAEEIAKQCSNHFGWHGNPQAFGIIPGAATSTAGVMQPTGDRWGEHPEAANPAHRSAYIDRVAGSPWMGREFCLRVNQGRGPLWPDYYHMGCDEELQAVATRLGVFWQRPDLIHLHRHWGRAREGERMGSADRMPEFLKRANSAEEWKKYKKLFAEREAAGFPGSEPL